MPINYFLLYSPDFPPVLDRRDISSKIIALSTALHMSYMVRSVVVTAVRASISTPIWPVVLTLASTWIDTRPSLSKAGSSLKVISTDVRKRGWHMGMSSDVFFSPMMPATWATARSEEHTSEL